MDSFRLTTSLFLALQALAVIAAPTGELAERATSPAVVDVNTNNGAPKYYASGFINGVPFNYPNQIPAHYFTDIKLQNCRAGGGQGNGQSNSGGWNQGQTKFNNLFASVMNQYKTCSNAGADFILGVHGLWGSSTVWPGDNGNWTNYDGFVNAIKDGLVQYGATNVVWDIWNESEQTWSWNPLGGNSQQQWIDMYVRTHKAIRADSRMNNVTTSGPTLGAAPSTTQTWWSNWAKQIKGNNTIPDFYAWHNEGGIYTPTLTSQASALSSVLSTYGLPTRPVNINEYGPGTLDRYPSSFTWWIAQLERQNWWGCLSDWDSGLTLSDLMADLLTKTDNWATYSSTNYTPGQGFPLFQYYAQSMAGTRLATTASGDSQLDAYATKDSSTVRIIAGTRAVTGTWSVQVKNLGSIGYVDGSSVSVTTKQFLGANDVHAASPGAPNLGAAAYSVSGGAITIPINYSNNHTGWVFEFPVKA